MSRSQGYQLSNMWDAPQTVVKSSCIHGNLRAHPNAATPQGNKPLSRDYPPPLSLNMALLRPLFPEDAHWGGVPLDDPMTYPLCFCCRQQAASWGSLKHWVGILHLRLARLIFHLRCLELLWTDCWQWRGSVKSICDPQNVFSTARHSSFGCQVPQAEPQIPQLFAAACDDAHGLVQPRCRQVWTTICSIWLFLWRHHLNATWRLN